MKGDGDIAAGNTIEVMAGVRSDRGAEASASLAGIFAARNDRDYLLDALHATTGPLHFRPPAPVPDMRSQPASAPNWQAAQPTPDSC